jgi:hypothetical protein
MKNNNQQQQEGNNLTPFFSSVVDKGKGFEHHSFSSPSLCKYHDSICPLNIKKYSMKCIYGKKDCQVRKYFKRFEGLDLNMLGVGS